MATVVVAVVVVVVAVDAANEKKNAIDNDNCLSVH